MRNKTLLDKQIRELRQKVEKELISPDKDHDKLIKLSTELDILILLHYRNPKTNNMC